LLHQIPAKPDYLRVKVWRRMQRIGAIPLKNAAWVLPANDTTMEDFQWLIREIRADGGDALLCEARFLTGLTAAQIEALAKAQEARTAIATPPVAGTQALRPDEPDQRGALHRRTWVTRRGVYVDRMASAWLIRRHIDPHARFRFVAPDDYAHAGDEIRFDMYEAEYSHVGDSCTFEVLASTFIPGDRAVAAIAEIVHDIDFKEPRFGRSETAGVKLLVDGIEALAADDHVRLERAYPIFDALYAALRVGNHISVSAGS
jgi:hypothetical protein